MYLRQLAAAREILVGLEEILGEAVAERCNSTVKYHWATPWRGPNGLLREVIVRVDVDGFAEGLILSRFPHEESIGFALTGHPERLAEIAEAIRQIQAGLRRRPETRSFA